MKIRGVLPIGIVTTFALIMATPTVAHANSNESDADEIAQLISEVAPSLPDTAPLESSDDGRALSESGSASVEVAVAAAGVAVNLTPTDAPAVDVTLTSANAGSIDVSDNGTAVGIGEETSVAVNATDEGVRIQTVHSDASSLTSTYEFHDVALEHRADGTVEIWSSANAASVDLPDDLEVTDDLSVEVLAAVIEAPWAVDASGAHVDTHFVVDGNTLTQEVSPRADAAYPIVADPYLRVINPGYIRVQYSWAETQTIFHNRNNQDYLIMVCTGVSAAATGYFGPVVAGSAGALTGAICGAYIARIKAQVTYAYQYRRCLQMNYYPFAAWTSGYTTYSCLK